MASDAVDFGNDTGLEPADLAHLNGAPFSQSEIDAAVATVRDAAYWHIGPEREETIVLDVPFWQQKLRLPTRKLVEVSEIRDTETGTVIDAERYRVSHRSNYVRYRCGLWPCGEERIEADIVHGFEVFPADLLPVLAEAMVLSRRDQTAKQFAAGPYTAGFGADTGLAQSPLSSSSVLERYSLLVTNPGIA